MKGKNTRWGLPFILLVAFLTGCCPPEPETTEASWPLDSNLYGDYSSSVGSITGWAPVYLVVSVHDRDGNDLLDPEREGNFFKGATLRFRGKTYTAKQPEDASSRAYETQIYGWILYKQEVYYLFFGEIDGAADMDEDLVLQWPDGSSDTIHYHCAKHNKTKLTCERSWKLNGKTGSNPFALIK